MGTLVVAVAARMTTATTHRVAVSVVPHAVATTVVVSVVALAAVLPAVTIAARLPVVKAAVLQAATIAAVIVVLPHAVTARVMAASLVLVTQAVVALLPVATRAHRAVISHPASPRLPSLLVVAASLSWPTTPASVLLARLAER